MRIFLTLTFFCFLLSCSTKNQLHNLIDEVEVFQDNNGINHIYANNQEDLFFMQGYLAAKDRLFQFEIWRRQATGTVSEILGADELERDIGTRLFKFRGNIEDESNHYHDDGYKIITSYVNGVNAYIDEVNKDPDKLPIEFTLLNIKPELWTPEVVISRHQGLLGNITQELNIGRAVSRIGEKKVKDLMWFHPKEPSLKLHKKIRKEDLEKDILALYNAYRRPIRFKKEHIVEKYRRENNKEISFNNQIDKMDEFSIGSNNWAISGSKSKNGYPILANDPHRTIVGPSLRYISHLVAPGWNVIGGGEPEIPGISIGHNEFGAWGLTVFRTDAEDLYVYEINPNNFNEYKHNGEWNKFMTIEESIPVKGMKDQKVILYYSIHGPVTLIDSVENRAYAVRCGWLEIGGSPYLASLRMNQSRTWEEFRDACNYSNIPGENMVWADKMGNIGWQAVGIAPIRNNHSGMVPVLGNGDYEWDGYLPIIEKPNIYNPIDKFFATANQNVTSETYTNWNAIGFSWSDPYRGDRVNDVLKSNTSFTMDDMKRLQVDYHSLPSEELTKMLSKVNFNNTEKSIVRCPDSKTAKKMEDLIKKTRKAGDTVGGIVSCVIRNVPIGLGEPVFNKLHSELGRAMLSINAVKGFEFGSGFKGSKMKGSEHNDIFTKDGKTKTNLSGGIQGGISNGMDIYFNVAFKPVSTIMKDQDTINSKGKSVKIKGKGRHDPCVVPRAVPIVEAMSAIVIADFIY